MKGIFFGTLLLHRLGSRDAASASHITKATDEHERRWQLGRRDAAML